MMDLEMEAKMEQKEEEKREKIKLNELRRNNFFSNRASKACNSSYDLQNDMNDPVKQESEI